MSSNQKFSISASDRYALALFELAQEESQLDRIEKEAEEFRKLTFEINRRPVERSTSYDYLKVFEN